MNTEVKELINLAVSKMIDNTSSDAAINRIKKKHDVKIHFIPKRYRVFGGLLQSMNIQFGNFIETLMEVLIANEGKYEILEQYSGKKSNLFTLSAANDAKIDSYITRCQYETDIDIEEEFPRLLQSIVEETDTRTMTFEHDIDLLFRDKETGTVYYMESKYNDDHDTGKFVDINRKFIKTYAYLCREFGATSVSQIVPILFFFTNKKLKGNIYIPERTNIKRGRTFFTQFLHVDYDDVDSYLSMLSESEDVVAMFDALYRKVMLVR